MHRNNHAAMRRSEAARVHFGVHEAKAIVRDSEAHRFRHNTLSENFKASRRSVPPITGQFYATLGPLQKASLIAGVTTAPFGLSATLTAIESSPHFTWTGQTISSLLNGPNGLLLSASLVTSGALASSFTYGFRESLPPSRLYDAGAILFVASSAALSVAGVVHPPDTLHYVAAGTYFVGAPSMMGMMGGGMVANGAKRTGALTITAATIALVSAGVGLAQSTHLSALYEFISSSAIGTWVFGASGYALVKDRIMNVGKKGSKES